MSAPGEDVATLAHTFKARVYEACVDLFGDEESTAVSFGMPGSYHADDLVAVMRLTSDQVAGPLTGGPQGRRSRDETLTLEVLFSAFRGGGSDAAEIVAAERAYDLLRRLERRARMEDPTLGGLVFWWHLLRHESEGITDPDVLTHGRNITVTATFEARARVAR